MRRDAALAVVVGLVLTLCLVRALHSAWTGCELGGPVDDDFPGGEAYTWLGPDLVRFVIYGTTFAVAAVFGRRWITRPGMGGTALRVLLIVGLCAVPFGIDYAWGVRMDVGTFDPGRCPGGVPIWWPL